MIHQPQSPMQAHVECLRLQKFIEDLRQEKKKRLLEPKDTFTLEDSIVDLKKNVILETLNKRLEQYSL